MDPGRDRTGLADQQRPELDSDLGRHRHRKIIIWARDINTAPKQNTYGFAAYYNAGPVQVY